MTRKRWTILALLAAWLQLSSLALAQTVSTDTWPPALAGADKNGTVKLSSPELLKVPEVVQKPLAAGQAKLEIAKTVPTVYLAYDNKLPDAALNGTGWSAWGDIALASDGKVYSGTGDHGGYEKGRSFIYCWDPATKALTQIADLIQVSGAKPGEIHFSKVHAGIIEGKDKKIYYTGTLDDGGLAGIDKKILSMWTEHIPGGQLYQFDPATGKNSVYANFPNARVTATTLYDHEADVLYCCLEGAPDGVALGAFDMAKKEWIFQSKAGTVALDRVIALDKKGNVYFNGPMDEAKYATLLTEAQTKLDTEYAQAKATAAAANQAEPKKPELVKPNPNATSQLWKYDPKTKSISATKSAFPDAGMRSATRESKAGFIWGTSMSGQLYRYSPTKDELTLLGPNFLEKGDYITVCDLSPDEKYVYYFPGAHGTAVGSGTPVIQYEIATGKQKALAFLYDAMASALNYAPGGTYGLKISADGSTLYVNLNGSPRKEIRPKGIQEGFGLTAFMAFEVPAVERGGQ